ncbi:hybrid sensor histidine kinase/response regulator [Celeribacter neptunius]|uniref:Histidine kinase-, DNA gyrase B-, and HSP90-like ATPase n=1 Tax=Celeribacter neptunius TaxID=588602 RepID=A0A1I3WB09_9RHOB|nr:response regulator [Celeribacter neptunius]SFK03927.1 Histidine kinase-, DNA gyrase B-, and HSP90-like ATPase [Celeribacter neptunius]
MRQSDQKNPSLLIEDAGRLSLLAHDIRSTYTELQSALNTLDQAYDLPETTREEISRIAQTSAHLGRLLDRTSGVIFQETQTLPQRAGTPPNPRKTFDALFRRWQGITGRMGSSLTLIGGENMPESADIDMLALERILSNLVSNALLHAAPGPISIEITRFGTSPNERLKFCIRDAGPGFPEQALNEESPAPVPIGSGEPGSGYGLRVARDAARCLGGFLCLENAPAGGGEACLTIPIPERQDMPEAPDGSIGTAPSLPAGYTALLVEDSAALRRELRHELEALGLFVIEAHDGAAALELLSAPDETPVDLVLLDIELPLLSGLQLLSALRAQGVTLPPVIAVTAHVFAPNLHKISQNGVVAVLRKPVQSRTALRKLIIDTLRDAPPKGPQQSAARSQAAKRATGDLGIAPLASSLEDLAARFPAPAAQEILTQLASDLNKYLTVAERAAQGGLTDADRDMISRAAHSLSSLFGLACDATAQQAARQLSRDVMFCDRGEVIAVLRHLRQYNSNIQPKILSILNSEQSANVSDPHSDR